MMGEEKMWRHPDGTDKPYPPAPPAVTDAPSLADVLSAICREVQNAEEAWPPMNSAHEAYAILLEEVDELKEHVWTNQKRRDLKAMRKEAVQVAAMAVCLIRDICDGGRGHK